MPEEEGPELPPAPGGPPMEEIEQPYLEDLILFALRYGEEPTLRKAPKIIKRARAAGHLGAAIHILQLMISNCSEPPYYLHPWPKDCQLLDVVVLDEEKELEPLRDAVALDPQHPNCITVVVYLERDRKTVGAVGWHHVWAPVKIGKDYWVTRPLSVLELTAVLRTIRTRRPEPPAEPEAPPPAGPAILVPPGAAPEQTKTDK